MGWATKAQWVIIIIYNRTGTDRHKNNLTKNNSYSKSFQNITKSVSDNIYTYIFIFRSKIHGTVEQGDDSPQSPKAK